MQRMSGLERVLLFLPVPGALFFGVAPLLVPVALARAFGYSGDDPYLMRLAGAATLGYGVAFVVGVVKTLIQASGPYVVWSELSRIHRRHEQWVPIGGDFGLAATQSCWPLARAPSDRQPPRSEAEPTRAPPRA
jgi:hypothetical protein